MEQLMGPKSVSLLRLAARFNRKTLRYVATQADMPGIKKTSDNVTDPLKTADSTTAPPPGFPGKLPGTPAGSASPAETGARMTSAGVLLPKDGQEKVEKLEHAKDESESERKKTKESGRTERQYGRGMKAWQISQFGDVAGLELVSDCRIPAIRDPFDMLVEIHAASINPFDIEMTRGYGDNLIQYMRRAASFSWVPQNLFSRKATPFPLTLGRDFSGTVIDAGKLVKGIRSGDEIFGVIGPHRQGTLAQYASTSAWCVAKKPQTISHTDAAGLPYIACTAWQVLKLVQNLPSSGEKRVLLLGASGGVGSFSLQYLKSLDNVHVTAVCGTASMDVVASLGADDMIDYQATNVEDELKFREKYDLIFQASGGDYDFAKKYLKGNLKSFFVTLNYPLLKNIDQYGAIAGMGKTAADFSIEYAKGLAKGYHLVWAFFAPNSWFLDEVTKMVEQGKIRPIVDKVYKFDDAPAAFRQVDAGDTKGKVVVQIKE